jgi:NADPH-dependent 2,4-dienoyl-CoA reductase/sulfur reductase-like enzyme
MSRTLDKILAEPLVQLHVEHGVRVICGKGVNTLLGTERVEEVELADGTRIPADLVVVGVGARPAIDWLNDSKIEVDDGILTGSTLQTSVPNIYAAGDVARWPEEPGAASIRVEHWTNAKDQGAIAAANLLDPLSARQNRTDHYVWSDQYGKRLQVAGDPRRGEIRFLTGGPGSDSYLAAAVLNDVVVGGVGFGVGKPFQKVRRLVANRANWHDIAELTWSAT